MSLTLAFDLFTETAPEPTILQLQQASQVLQEATERSRALREDLVFPPVPTLRQLTEQFGDERDAEMRQGLGIAPKRATFDPYLYAFVAQAKHHCHTDPALTSTGTDTAGRVLYNEREVARFANELLRGVRSDRPGFTPERWGEAIATVRTIAQKARETGGKS